MTSQDGKGEVFNSGNKKKRCHNCEIEEEVGG